MTPPSDRLLYLTQWFTPEPVAVPLWIAQALRRSGWDVEVVTGHPNYPDGVVHAGYDQRKFAGDFQDGFRVLRTPLYASHDASAARRMLNYLSWALGASFVVPWRSRGAGATLVYSSPATAALPAMVARMVTGRRYVLLVQDIWPDSVTASGFIRSRALSNVVRRLLTMFVDATYKMATAVVVISPGAAELLTDRGVPKSKLQVVHNWADESVMHPSPRTGVLRRRFGLRDSDFVVMYAGTLGPAQALETTVRAVAHAGDHVHLVVVGAGVERESLAKLAGDLIPGRVHFHDPVPLQDVASVMAEADAQLVSLAADPVFEVTMPSKVQSVLACGSFVIASAPGDAGRTVAAAGGLAVPPGDVNLLARAIDKAASMSRSERRDRCEQALAYYRDELSEAAGATRLSEILARTTRKETVNG